MRVVSTVSEATVGDAATVGRSALRKAAWRLLPLLGLGYGVAYMDRTNISFASLQMNADLHFSQAVYGLGAGLFFLSYAALELPSNVLLVRLGARRWIARIMITWGVIAVGMMFVRTPIQFYVMRFLLGAAEAGFFPGVMYYLTRWFPAEERARAIGRFYVAYPLSSVVMGSLAGWLLGLRGQMGLAGWQWLFVIEGAPAIALSLVFLILLPDEPETAPWLTAEERGWLVGRLSAERAAQGGERHRLMDALAHPTILLLGLASFFIMGVSYAFNLSAPAILKETTGFSPGAIGWLVALIYLLGAGGMLANAQHSDRTGERRWHVIAPQICIAAACLAGGLVANAWVVVIAYTLIVIGQNAVQTVIWTIPGQILSGRGGAAGFAAVGALSMIGGFFGPWLMGLVRDATGSFSLGFALLAIPSVLAAATILALPRTVGPQVE
jgi:ACS family tartrate transporter-like MFS transporter